MVESRTIRIPENLFNSIQKVILIDKELRYESPNELIIDAIRRRIEEILSLNKPYEVNKKEKKVILDFV